MVLISLLINRPTLTINRQKKINSKAKGKGRFLI